MYGEGWEGEFKFHFFLTFEPYITVKIQIMDENLK